MGSSWNIVTDWHVPCQHKFENFFSFHQIIEKLNRKKQQTPPSSSSASVLRHFDLNVFGFFVLVSHQPLRFVRGVFPRMTLCKSLSFWDAKGEGLMSCVDLFVSNFEQFHIWHTHTHELSWHQISNPPTGIILHNCTKFNLEFKKKKEPRNCRIKNEFSANEVSKTHECLWYALSG